MSLLVVGLSHHTAPVGILERASIAHEDTRKVLTELLECEHLSEALLLSTCNRVEVYAVVQTFHGGLADISGVLARHAAATLDELSGHLYVHYAGAGVAHLFRVASGLESMVVGEPQILGQLRAGYREAVAAASIGRTLHELVQQALRVGKRVHTETGIDAAGASVVSEALADASAALRGGSERGAALAGRRALVIGAGSMGGLAAAQLRRAGVVEVVVANRSIGPARRLAAACEAEGVPSRAVGLDDLTAALRTADIVVSCTGAVGTVLSTEQVLTARTNRTTPLVICDLGLPRDMEPGVGELTGVTLVDLATLQRRLESVAGGVDTDSAHRIVTEEVRAYLSAQRSAEITPTVTALRKRAAEVVDAELLRLDGKLPGLDVTVRDELARTVRRVVDKLLHTPTVRVKQFAETGDGKAYADALRELFGLDPQTAAAMSAAVATARLEGEDLP
ncbi:MAG: glutamyl-tRNA reductase [Actinomycetota bacterium]|nr:glutamyl-tRNA reductase [Actinomycetota bacterium]